MDITAMMENEVALRREELPDTMNSFRAHVRDNHFSYLVIKLYDYLYFFF